jgi:hypothetical protein
LGATGFTGSQGIPGEAAALGYAGSRGSTSTITIGVVTTATAGSLPTITNTGTQYDAVLNFSIPQGYTGSQGAGFTGSQGAPGTGLNIVGFVGSAAGLPNPYNGTIGDGYLTTNNGNLHVWMNPTWLDVGQIRGYTGSAGSGFSGSGGGGGGGSGGSPNLDGGIPNTIYGGISPIDGGGVVI